MLGTSGILFVVLHALLFFVAWCFTSRPVLERAVFVLFQDTIVVCALPTSPKLPWADVAFFGVTSCKRPSRDQVLASLEGPLFLVPVAIFSLRRNESHDKLRR